MISNYMSINLVATLYHLPEVLKQLKELLFKIDCFWCLPSVAPFANLWVTHVSNQRGSLSWFQCMDRISGSRYKLVKYDDF